MNCYFMSQQANNRNKYKINVPAKRLCYMMIFHNRLNVRMHREIFAVWLVMAIVASCIGDTINLESSPENELPKPFETDIAQHEPELPALLSNFDDDDGEIATDELPSPLVSDIRSELDETTTLNGTHIGDFFTGAALTGKKMKENGTISKNSTRHRNRNRKKNSMVRMAVQAAAEAGLQAMIKLYEKTEPDLLASGNFLHPEDPGAKLSSFSAPTEGNENAMKSGYAALVTAKKLKESLNLDYLGIGRQQPPKISLRRTPLEGLCPSRDPPRCLPATRKYRTHDGTCNNVKNLRWGSAQMPFHRFLAPDYSDGVEDIRGSVRGGILPSARFVSLVVHGFQEGAEAPVTMMLAQFGQFIDHDLTSTMQPRSVNGSVPSCCRQTASLHPSCLPIRVPRDDPWLAPLGVRCLEFLRSAPAQRRDCLLSWREQTNQATSYLDGSTIYSSNSRTSDNARVFQDGLLIYGRGNPREDVCLRGALASRCVKPGDTRSGEQPGLLAMHMVWVGEHNRIANQLADMNPHWSDEKIYQEARRIVGAMVQHITYREFLPLVLGKEVCKLFELELKPSGYYTEYDARVNPSVANAFAASAFRFGHSLIQSTMMRTDKSHRFLRNNVSLHDENAEGDMGGPGSLERILRGMVNQKASRRDEFITPELTNHLFQASPFPFGMDLAAINIQRGRDHGLPSYTSWRGPCGLSQILDWNDLDNIVGPNSAHRIQQAYKHVNDIDLFVGGLAERPVVGGLVGPTFACIIAQQFSNLRKGDRYWYENSGFESSFTPAQLQSLRQVILSQIICRTLEGGTLQPHIFLPPEVPGNERLPCGLHTLAPIDLEPWLERDPFNIVGNGQIQQPQLDISSSTQRPILTSPPNIHFGHNNGLNKQTHVIDKVDLVSNGITGISRPSAISTDSKNKTKVDNKLDITATSSRPSSNTANPTKIKNKIDAVSSVDNKLDIGPTSMEEVVLLSTTSTKKPKTSKRPNNKLRPTAIINNKLDFSKVSGLVRTNDSVPTTTTTIPTRNTKRPHKHEKTNTTNNAVNRRSDDFEVDLTEMDEQMTGQLDRAELGETNDKLTARIDPGEERQFHMHLNGLTQRPSLQFSPQKWPNSNRLQPIVVQNHVYIVNPSTLSPTVTTRGYYSYNVGQSLYYENPYNIIKRVTTGKPDLQTYMYVNTTPKPPPTPSTTKQSIKKKPLVVEVVNDLVDSHSPNTLFKPLKKRRKVKTKPPKSYLVGPSSPRYLNSNEEYYDELEENTTERMHSGRKFTNRRSDNEQVDYVDKRVKMEPVSPIGLTVVDVPVVMNDPTNLQIEDEYETLNKTLRNYGNPVVDIDYDYGLRQSQYNRRTTTKRIYAQPVRTTSRPTYIEIPIKRPFENSFSPSYSHSTQRPYVTSEGFYTNPRPDNYYVSSTNRPYISNPINYDHHKIPLVVSGGRPYGTFGNYEYPTTRKADLQTFMIVETTKKTTPYYYQTTRRPTHRPTHRPSLKIPSSTLASVASSLYYPDKISLNSIKASSHYATNLHYPLISSSNTIFSHSVPSLSQSHVSTTTGSSYYHNAIASSSPSPYFVSPSSLSSHYASHFSSTPKPIRQNQRPDPFPTYNDGYGYAEQNFDEFGPSDDTFVGHDDGGYLRPHATRPAYTDYSTYNKNPTHTKYYYVENVLYKYDSRNAEIRQPVKRYADFYDVPLDEFGYNVDDFVNPYLRRTSKPKQGAKRVNSLLDLYDHKDEYKRVKPNGNLDFDFGLGSSYNMSIFSVGQGTQTKPNGQRPNIDSKLDMTMDEMDSDETTTDSWLFDEDGTQLKPEKIDSTNESKLTDIFSTGSTDIQTNVNDKLDKMTNDMITHNFEGRAINNKKFQELKILNSPERPDDWIFQEKKKLTFHLPEVPELKSFDTSAQEVPRPMFKQHHQADE